MICIGVHACGFIMIIKTHACHIETHCCAKHISLQNDVAKVEFVSKMCSALTCKKKYRIVPQPIFSKTRQRNAHPMDAIRSGPDLDGV